MKPLPHAGEFGGSGFWNHRSNKKNEDTERQLPHLFSPVPFNPISVSIHNPGEQRTILLANFQFAFLLTLGVERKHYHFGGL